MNCYPTAILLLYRLSHPPRLLSLSTAHRSEVVIVRVATSVVEFGLSSRYRHDSSSYLCYYVDVLLGCGEYIVAVPQILGL